MHARLILAASALLPLLLSTPTTSAATSSAATRAAGKATEAKAPAYDPVRYKSCTVYAATAMSAAADMQAKGYSAKRALVEGGNPPSPGMVSLTEFAASTMQARTASGRDAAATTTGFLAGICYPRSDLPTIE